MRELGRKLGINEELVQRHPFPGPGIAIRILGDVTPERVRIARQADHVSSEPRHPQLICSNGHQLTGSPKIFISMIKEAGLYNQISQAYAGLLVGAPVPL